MTNMLRSLPRLTALLDGVEVTPELVSRLASIAYFQAHVAYTDLLDVVLPQLPPIKQDHLLGVAERMDGDQIFEKSFLDDLSGLIASLKTEIDARSHVYWHGDENHTQGGYETIFREPGVTDFQHAVAELATLREATTATIFAAYRLRDAGASADN